MSRIVSPRAERAMFPIVIVFVSAITYFVVGDSIDPIFIFVVPLLLLLAFVVLSVALSL